VISVADIVYIIFSFFYLCMIIKVSFSFTLGGLGPSLVRESEKKNVEQRRGTFGSLAVAFSAGPKKVSVVPGASDTCTVRRGETNGVHRFCGACR
jgi:hypothetical protein